MPRVSVVDGWRSRPRGTEPARPDLPAQGARAQDHCAAIRSHGENCRRSAGEPGGSGPSPGRPELRLHLVRIPPDRCLPHWHTAAESAIYVLTCPVAVGE